MITALLCAIQPFSPSSRASAWITHREIDHDRGGDPDAPDHDEDAVGDRLLGTRDPGLRHRGRGTHCEQRVLRVETGEERAHSAGLHGPERVDRGHPFRRFRLGAGCGPLAPLTERHEEQQRADADLEHAPARRGPLVTGLGRARDGEHDRAHHGETEEPTRHEDRAVDAAPRRHEHQHHGDDRHRAQRDTDRHREDLTDRVRHRYR